MSNVAKLKKKAIELEQKKQFDKALAVYVQILDEAKEGDDADVALYNRVGDLMLRGGNVAEALNYYEKAIDLYADGGFFNNAIALCNKILRNSPGRSSIYYKLGKISAKKGFTSDAKQNFLEYADRMQKAGNIDEAFRALKEFADLCPDQDDVRLMLAEQLTKRDRKGEAMAQLQTLYEKFELEGRSQEARATADRMRAIDPASEPRVGTQAASAPKPGELVFLEVDYGDEPVRKPSQSGRQPAAAPPARPRQATPPRPAPPRPAAPPPPAAAAPAPPPRVESHPPQSEAPRGGELELYIPEDLEVAEPPAAVSGFETTAVDVSPEAANAPVIDDSMLGIERTSIGDTFGSSSFDTIPEIDTTGMLGNFDIAETAAPEGLVARPHDLTLPGELPVLDLPDFDGLGGGPDLPLIMPDDPLPPRRPSSEVLAELEPPISGDGIDPPLIELTGFEFDIQKEDSAFLAVDEPDTMVEEEPPPPALRDPAPPPPVAAPRRQEPPAAVPAAHGKPNPAAAVEELTRRVAQTPDDFALRRRLAEAHFERGERDHGLQELELAMIGFERGSDFESSRSVADEIIRLDPDSIRHHQKRVQYAFQANDTKRLVDAYLELADALFRTGQSEKARTVYQRVLDLAPNDVRAQAALTTFGDAGAAPPEPPPPAKGQSGAVRRYSANTKRPSAPAAPPPPKPPRARPPESDDEFVNLGDWLRDDEVPKSTRMVVEEQAPTGDEQADFADMLKKFKRGIAENVEEEDHQSHYDLGVAFKEMGLLDEAIGQFQKALRGSDQSIRTCEALGQCFLERSQFDAAAAILKRAVADRRVGDEQLVGVLYLLGYASEALDRYEEALTYYQRVFSVDIQFRDVAERIRTLEKVAQ